MEFTMLAHSVDAAVDAGVPADADPDADPGPDADRRHRPGR
ncbi:hypothetical protein [Streptomyces sp. TLI_171]|nr:hypothetical protein [Streptomyces sp. TLI_171]